MSNYLRVYQDLFAYGQTVSPRGEKVIEIENYQFTLDPYERLTSFQARNLNLEYCKQEFLWYLRAFRFDTSIEQYASAWKKIRDVDGGFNSNYGQYIFRNPDNQCDQISWVVEELCRDTDSRRACIVLLSREHLRQNNPDVICTYGLSFRIREGQLNMSVSMRSNDAIFGMTNDTFCFSMIHEMVYQRLRAEGYTTLLLGTYTHKVDSLHVYERHFEMLNHLVRQGLDGYYPIEIPRGTSKDFLDLRILAGWDKKALAALLPDKGPLVQWFFEEMKA